jgi:nitroreductase
MFQMVASANGTARVTTSLLKGFAMSQPNRQAEYPIHDQFTARWSPRAFKDTALSEAELMRLFEAARWAPSASNNQPWRFAYGLRGDDGFAKIADALVPNNRAWAEKAGALVAVASATTVVRDGVANPNAWHAFDSGTAWGYFALQAHHSGLAVHAMGGFDAARLAENLNLPEGYVLHAVVAVGHRGEASQLPEPLQSREAPNGRRPISETVGHGGFK